jgi:hypothetical protein
MKKCISLLIIGLFICLVVNAQYRINKKKYDYQSYIRLPGDPYNPAGAGFASMVVPGLGQALSDEPGRGLAFFGGSVGCLFLAASALEIHNPDIAERTAILSGIGIISLWIWSITDASRVAKVNNLAWRDRNKASLKLELLPNISTLNYAGPDKITAGISLKITFQN